MTAHGSLRRVALMFLIQKLLKYSFFVQIIRFYHGLHGVEYVPFLQLDYKVDDAKLREVFGLAGKVVDAEVVKDRDGRSRGFGVLKMSHPVEAVQVL